MPTEVVSNINAIRYPASHNHRVNLNHIGGDTLYYSQGMNVSAAVNDGSLTNGQSLQLFTDTWLISAGKTTLRVTPVDQEGVFGSKIDEEELSTELGTIITSVREAPINVTYPEIGCLLDGTDESTKFQSAINLAATADHGSVLVPGGLLNLIDIEWASNVDLIGMGRDSTVIKKSGAGDLFKFHGSASVSGHVTYCSMRDLTLWGNAQTGRLIDAVYADNLNFRNLFLRGNSGVGLDLVEVWDSVFDNIVCDGVNSSTEPAIWVRSSRAASGFGQSNDNSNVLRFNNCRCESWKAGALRIEPGTGFVQQPNHIFVDKFKAESYFLRGPGIYASAGSVIDMKDIYVHMGGFDSGFSTAQNAFYVDIGVSGSFRDVHISNDSGSATIEQGMYVWCGTPVVIDNVRGQYLTAPTSGHHINLAGGGPYNVRGHNEGSGATNNVRRGTGVAVYDPLPFMDSPNSAATLGVPIARFRDVQGTTGISAMTVAPAGFVTTLKFNGSLTVTHGTGASALALAGAANFSATAGDTLTVISDGTRWHEVSRTVI